MGDYTNDKKIIYEKPVVEESNALKMELSSFINAVVDKKRPAVSGEDGREALRVAIEITHTIKNQMQNFGIK